MEVEPVFVMSCIGSDAVWFLSETVLKFRALKKPAQLAVINSLEKVHVLILTQYLTAVCILSHWFYMCFCCAVLCVCAGILELGGELP